jgi:hypothetical protein
VSCGAALHHARVTLAVQGLQTYVERMPAATDADLLARVRVVGTHEVGTDDLRAHHSIRVRRSDRRAFQVGKPSEHTVARLCAAALAQGVSVTVVEADELRFLGFATAGAVTIEARAQAYEDDFADWSSRTYSAGTPDAPQPRPIEDMFATYIVLCTSSDTPLDWLQAGEATSAALLAATAQGLASSMMSEAVEVPGARTLLRRVSSRIGHPQLVLRVGVNDSAPPQPYSGRRPAADMIEVMSSTAE